MLDNRSYIILSLQLHLFFARIMKEHSLFLEAGFTFKNSRLSKEAEYYKVQFQKLLYDTVKLSNGKDVQCVLDAGEVFTNYTLNAEKKTEYYTGIHIDSKITIMEQDLKCRDYYNYKEVKCIKELNCRAKKLLDGLINFKIKILNDMICCKLFTSNYPLLIEHILREAKLYRSYVKTLEKNEDIEDLNKSEIMDSEMFWNHIMMEHSLFMRGLLDPGEDKLIDTCDKFAKDYNSLIKTSGGTEDFTKDSLELTEKLKEFKKAGVEGIEDCKIKSIILPLLADHVLREANHYIRLLNNYKN